MTRRVDTGGVRRNVTLRSRLDELEAFVRRLPATLELLVGDDGRIVALLMPTNTPAAIAGRGDTAAEALVALHDELERMAGT